MESTNNDNNLEQDAFGTPYESATEQPTNAAEFAAPEGSGPKVDKVEYCKAYADPSIGKNITAAGIIAYVCAGINLLMVFLSGPVVLLDVCLLLGMGLGIHLKKSVACSVVLTAYGVFGMILSIILNGKVSGWLIPAAGIIALIFTLRLDKEYKAYLAK